MQPYSQPFFCVSAGDPNWSSVVLLADFDGTNGATSFSDESGKAHGAATFVGTAALDTSKAQFGTASLGAGTGGVTWASSTDWAFGTGSFTVECWIYVTSVSGTQGIVTNFNDGSGVGSWLIRLNGSTLEWWGYNGSIVNDLSWAGGAAITTSTWHHICVDYDGVKYRLYFDGVTKATFSTGRNMTANSEPVSVGNDTFGGWPLHGNVDEVRITKGVARYATDTSFTVPSTAFPRH